ncbi:MAG: hypothetical protein GXP48_05325 [Acidobacteria bacterium]|nr:hypothetical protein [Acidobacteriota bacterium]
MSGTPKKSVFVRIVVLTFGWILVILGIAGLFLPILQGVLLIAAGLWVLRVENRPPPPRKDPPQIPPPRRQAHLLATTLAPPPRPVEEEKVTSPATSPTPAVPVATPNGAALPRW